MTISAKILSIGADNPVPALESESANIAASPNSTPEPPASTTEPADSPTSPIPPTTIAPKAPVAELADDSRKVPPPAPTNSRRLDSAGFPDSPRAGSSIIPLTVDNVEYLLRGIGLTLQFDVLKKRPEMRWKDGKSATTNDIISAANINGLGGSG